MTRTFDDRPAVREKTPILVGLVGPSGTGKTYSALRLAAGFQRVSGGETFVIDTEARRALHYADKFSFRHVPFGAPFSPLDYLAAIEHCIKRGASTIIVDSMSHEHEGPGGVLEMHAAEHKRLGGSEKVKLLAWGKPKSERRRLINSILQMSCNFVFCFRAKEKLKMERGKDPEPMGFMPIAGDEFVYEMTLKCLLLPGANGTPTWQSGFIGEKAMIKLPEQFRSTFATGPQLTEDIGQQLATWAAGAAAPVVASADDLIARFDSCSDSATHRSLEDARRLAWQAMSKTDKARVKSASEEAHERILRAERAFEDDGPPPDDYGEQDAS
ncbi:MAG: AAA family ATPase [Kofleriaceae bacterium]